MTTSNIEILPSVWEHVLELKEDLREGERQEIMAFGISPEEGLTHSFRVANLKRTALVDGKVAAMWGVQGNLLGQIGHPFLLTGNEALKVSSFRFASIYLNELSQMKEMYPILENYVDARYEGAVRLLKIAGFKLEPANIMNHDFYKFSMVS